MVIKSIEIFNTVLTLSCVGLGVALYSVSGGAQLDAIPGAARVSQSAVPIAEQKGPEEQATAPRRPVLAEYDLVLARDFFRDPNPRPKPQIRAVPAPKLPLPTLAGVVFIGDEGKAILKTRDGQEVYGVGESVAGGIIARIEADRVVINLPGRSAEILLKGSLKRIAPPESVAQAGENPGSKVESTGTGRNAVSRAREATGSKATKRLERLRRFKERMKSQREGLKQ